MVSAKRCFDFVLLFFSLTVGPRSQARGLLNMLALLFLLVGTTFAQSNFSAGPTTSNHVNWTPTQWAAYQVLLMKSPFNAPNAFYGGAVAISGDGLTMAVCAQNDSRLVRTGGALYLYRYYPSSWSQ
jgi:hypothetical protein